MRIFHFNIPSPAGNFGDDILFYSTQYQFEQIFNESIHWITYPLRNHTTKKVIEKANTCDLILVGGGGLLLKDTARNNYSGWQWACSYNHLQMIKKPLIIYAIGYNRFRGQEDFEEPFITHLKATIEKASFFSVRNIGSRESLKKYGISEKDVYINPCPSLFYPQILSNSIDGINIGINLAGDRALLRYDQKGFYRDLLEICESLIRNNINLHFFYHNWNPASNCQDFVDQVSKKEIHNIETVWDVKDINDALRLYNSMDLILAMRTHAQIVSFGQHNKVLSLISHDKLKWFLDDMGMSDTGLEVTNKNFSGKLKDLINFLLFDDSYFERQDKALKKQKDLIDSNNEIIRNIVCQNT